MKTRIFDPAALDIEPITSNRAYKELFDEFEAIEHRLIETRKRRERAVALRRGVSAGRSVVDRAKDLVAGGRIPPIDPAGEIAACDSEEYDVLRPALREVSARIADMRGDLSLVVARRVAAAHTAALRAAVKAIEDTWNNFEAAAAIRATIRGAGYDVLDSVTPQTVPPSVWGLANGLDFWRHCLAAQGFEL